MNEGDLADHLIALLASAIWGLLALLIAWRFGLFRYPSEEALPKEKIHWRQVLGAFTAFLAVEFILMPTLFFIWASINQGVFVDIGKVKLDTVTQGWLNLIGVVLAAVAIGTYCYFQEPRSVKSLWGMNQDVDGAIRNFCIGSATWLIAYPCIGVVGQLIEIIGSFVHHGPHIDQVAVHHLKNVMNHPRLFWSMVVVIITVVPVLEELLFRGFLQTWLKGILGIKSAILITSVVFALLHFSGSQGFDNLELLVSLFVLSCFLGFIRERQHSLWASIGLHSTFNAISIVLLGSGL